MWSALKESAFHLGKFLENRQRWWVPERRHDHCFESYSGLRMGKGCLGLVTIMLERSDPCVGTSNFGQSNAATSAHFIRHFCLQNFKSCGYTSAKNALKLRRGFQFLYFFREYVDVLMRLIGLEIFDEINFCWGYKIPLTKLLEMTAIFANIWQCRERGQHNLR